MDHHLKHWSVLSYMYLQVVVNVCQDSPLWLQKYMYSFLSLVYCCRTCTCMYIDVLELERQIKHCLYTKVDFSPLPVWHLREEGVELGARTICDALVD